MEEVSHVIRVLESAQQALISKDAPQLREISNQTLHSASIAQDSGSITLAVLIYTLSKLIERADYTKIKGWEIFVKKFNSWFSLAIKALKEEKYEEYEGYLENARKLLTTISVNLKPYIQEVFLKASINKASLIYEHGISMGKTSQLLGITQWELSDYMGQKKGEDNSYYTIDTKKRAKMAMEFFS